MLLQLSEVKKNYNKDRGLVNVSVTIKEGGFYLFVGANGSGKSTTIKLIANVLFNRKNQGNMINQFKNMIYLPDKRTYPKLLKASTYLDYYLANSIEKEQILFYLSRYQILDKAIGGLSKGMQQKLGIVQTILKEGDLYLLDEPTDGLDSMSIQLFKEDIKKLLSQNKTLIISTHHKTLFRDLKPIIYTFKEGICHEKK